MIFFFNDTATTEIYTLSLHDALPIYLERVLQAPEALRDRGELEAVGHVLRLEPGRPDAEDGPAARDHVDRGGDLGHQDRKSTRLNSSHANISYAVFCLKKKKMPSVVI